MPDKGINKETIVACVPHLMAFPLTFVDFCLVWHSFVPRPTKDQYIMKIHCATSFMPRIVTEGN